MAITYVKCNIWVLKHHRLRPTDINVLLWKYNKKASILGHRRERKTGGDIVKKHTKKHAVLPQWSSQLIRGMPQSDPFCPHWDKLFLFLKFCSLLAYVVYFPVLSVSVPNEDKQVSAFARQSWMQCCSGQLCVYDSMGWWAERERDPFWSLKIDWRERFWHRVWRCTFWALEWDQVCESTEDWNTTETLSSKQAKHLPSPVRILQ